MIPPQKPDPTGLPHIPLRNCTRRAEARRDRVMAVTAVLEWKSAASPCIDLAPSVAQKWRCGNDPRNVGDRGALPTSTPPPSTSTYRFLTNTLTAGRAEERSGELRQAGDTSGNGPTCLGSGGKWRLPREIYKQDLRGDVTLTMSETIPLTDYAAAFVQALRQRTQVPRAVTPGTIVSGTASSQKLVSIHRKGCSIQLVGAWSEADPRLTSPFRPLSNRLSGSRIALAAMRTRSTTGTSRISA